MKSLVIGVLATICSTTVLADPQAQSASPSAERAFDCGAGQHADLVLRTVTPPGSKDTAYNGVATMQVNGGAADPMTLRFLNEKIAGRTIEALAETCRTEAMDLVFSTSVDGAMTDMLTVTIQGNTVMVR